MSSEHWTPPRAAVTPAWLKDELRSDVAVTIARDERTLLDKLSGGPVADLVLLGGGDLGRRTIAGLRRSGVEPFAFGDNSADLQGTVVDDVRVLAPAAAAAEFGARATRQSDRHRLQALIESMCPDCSLFLRRQGPHGDLVCFAIPDARLRLNWES